jgi:prevent-host-death family protein
MTGRNFLTKKIGPSTYNAEPCGRLVVIVQLTVQIRRNAMRQLSLTQARAQLSTLVADVDKGKGPVAIAQRSKIKAVLVDAEWHSRVEEELSHYRRVAKQSPLKLRGSMRLVGNVDEAIAELRKEREESLEKLVSGLK